MNETKRPEIYAINYGDITETIINIWLERYKIELAKPPVIYRPTKYLETI